MVEWVLGDLRDKSLLHIITEVDPKTGAIYLPTTDMEPSDNPNARPKLTLDYKSCGVKGKVSIVYISDDLQILQQLPSQQGDQNGDFQDEDVNSDLNHFSRYAVYY